MMPGPARSRPGNDSDAAEDQREDEDQRDERPHYNIWSLVILSFFCDNNSKNEEEVERYWYSYRIPVGNGGLENN